MTFESASTGFSARLAAWRSGDSGVEKELLDEMYPMLRSIAQSQIRRQGKHITLRPTELSHEAFIRLCQDGPEQTRQNKAQFYAFAASMLRNILIDYLRERGAQKRGGDQPGWRCCRCFGNAS